MINEKLEKSIDELIDSVFAEEIVEKSIDIAGDAKKTSDEALNNPEASAWKSDESRGAGRSKQISDVPVTDQDGRRDSEYDTSISEDAKEEDQAEINQISDMSQIEEKNRMGSKAKAPEMAPFKKSLSEEEYNEYQELKKAKEASEAEELKKAEVAKQEELIKSVVERTTNEIKKSYEGKIESLEKSLAESNKMIKAMANAPRSSKSITGIEQLEKSVDESNAPKQETFSKSEMLDAAEELMMKGQLREDHVIELDNNGYIYDTNARKVLENYLSKK
jgi:hypothetical protein